VSFVLSIQNVTAGLEVLNAFTADRPGFTTFAEMKLNPDVGVSYTKDPATRHEIRSICPTYYKKIPAYNPAVVPFVIYCYIEVVDPELCFLVYSSTILKIITVMMAIKAAGLTLAMQQLRNRPIIVLDDAIKEYL